MKKENIFSGLKLIQIGSHCYPTLYTYFDHKGGFEYIFWMYGITVAPKREDFWKKA